MTRHNGHETHHEVALRGMDPATATRTDTWNDLPARARVDLDAIVATTDDVGASRGGVHVAPGERVEEPAGARGKGRARRSRRALVAAAVVVLAGGLAVPVVTTPAYAGWQQTPQAVDAAGTEAAAHACRAFWSRAGVRGAPGADGFPDAGQLRAVVSEKRGPFTFTVMRGPQGQFADCLLQTSWWRELVSAGDSGSGGGSMTPVPPVPDPAPDGIDTAMLGAVGPSQRTAFGLRLPGDSRARSYAYGRAGAQVVTVVLHTRAQGDLTASVQNGLWAAWWPSPGDAPEVSGPEATVTLRDGTTRRVSLDATAMRWSEG